MSGIRAVIFDMDGVIIDSEPLWRLAEQEVFAGLGVALDDAMCEQTMGWRIDEVVAHWYALSPWTGPGPADVETRILGRMRELIAQRGAAMPGAPGLLAGLRARGLPLALATSSPRVIIDAVIAALDLVGVFSVTCSAADELRGKPDPAVFLTAARRLGVPAGSCLVIEDSPSGLEAALAAGMRAIAVPAPNLRHDARFAAAQLTLDSLDDIDPCRLLDLPPGG